MFGIGMTELMVILVIGLVVIGPKKLPGLARSLGKSLAEFRRASDDMRREFLDVAQSIPEPPNDPERADESTDKPTDKPADKPTDPATADKPDAKPKADDGE